MKAWWERIIADSGQFFSLILLALVVLVLGQVIIRFANALIDRAGKGQLSKRGSVEEQKRWETIAGLLKNGIRYIVYFIVVVTILDRFGVPVLAILSAAGVLGVAIAFGAQSLFRDVIIGFFILLENQYSMGEYIEAQGVAGYVEQVTLRCTYLRDFDGRLHILPNGGMAIVTNHHRGASRVMIEITVPYEEDIDRALTLLQEVCDGIGRDNEGIIRETPRAMGVVNMTESGAVLRAWGQAAPMTQWGLERQLRKEAIAAFAQAGISISYPHSQVILTNQAAFGADRQQDEAAQTEGDSAD